MSPPIKFHDRDMTALNYIRAYNAFYRVPPTQNQIAVAVGYQRQNNRSVGVILNKLASAGHIERVLGHWYGIRVSEAPSPKRVGGAL
jgi:Ni,Fe-hydrogenase III component G